jgi:pimeloyl-ACP methyl ester carboxylesterase
VSAEPSVSHVPVGDVVLAVEDSGGTGTPLVLAHGLSATRRYVLHGSRLLAKAGYRVISYDARGHGESTPAPDRGEYTYDVLVGDLEGLMDALEIGRAVVGGASMGAATTLLLALRQPERVEALIQITPAYRGEADADEEGLHRWDELADGLEHDGADGFMRVYGEPPIEPRFRSIVERAIRQRLERHEHPEAVADALRVVVRSRPIESLEQLQQVRAPTLVVGSRDDADPEHPLEVAEAYAEQIPGAELIVEDPGSSPLAWRGAQLSKAIQVFLERHDLPP